MNQTETIAHESGKSILGWLGFGKDRTTNSAEEADAPSNTHPRLPGNMARQASSELLEAISSFLLSNDLEISSANLLAAHSVFAGSNVRLAREVRLKTQSHEAITQEWLDDAAQDDLPDQGQDDIEKLMVKAEESIEVFTATAKAAHDASSEYGSKLEKHSTELDRASETGEIVANLAELARVMLTQTRKIEAEMRQSEEEASSLRRSLATAKRDAEIDHLTGLPNRRAFEALLDHHYREAQKAIEPLSVAFCDIDHFKLVNDTYGHDTGDRVIKAIAEALGKISDDNCHVARHGGEEFVMLFRGKTPSEAYVSLDQVREQLANRKFVNRKTDEPIGQVTFSGGIADVFCYADPRTALAAADEALYRAKSGGRNQIVLAKASEQ